MKNTCNDSRLLYAGLACSAVLAAWGIGRKLSRRNVKLSLPTHRSHGHAVSSLPDGVQAGNTPPSPVDAKKLTRQLYIAASLLSTSVLADSSLEHYRGCFFNPAMFIAPASSALTLAESVADAFSSEFYSNRMRQCVFGSAVIVGIVGLAFHFHNIAKREGRFSWHNLFYAAPIGAPAAISMAGLFGLAAHKVNSRGNGVPPRLLGMSAGQALAGLTVTGLAGTVAEALLLHFRGAFQDPFMYLPVTIPPIAAIALAIAAAYPRPGILRFAAMALKSTGLVGLLGVGFHSYGIHRNMGGWHNWKQMILQGPPLPAPPAFTGMAFAGLSSLILLEERKAGI